MSAHEGLSARLNRKITLQQATLTADTVGGYVKSWNDMADIWAEVTPLRGQEALQGMQLQASQAVRFVIRWRSGVTAAMRISYNGRIYNIRAVINPQEKFEMLELLAEEGAGS